MKIKKINNIILNVNNNINNNSIESNQVIDESDQYKYKFKKTALLMDDLFEELKIYFPAFGISLKTQKEMENFKIGWAWVLSGENITTEKQIKNGLRTAMKSLTPFLPTPAQFAKWCVGTPQQNGLPDVEMAYLEASKNIYYANENCHWSHVVVFLAAKKVGFYRIRDRAQDETKKLFEEAYMYFFDRYIKGEELGSIPNKNVKQEKKSSNVSVEVVNNRLNQIRETLNHKKIEVN